MYQINKLRQKLANANKKSVEYRMSIEDARSLLKEIDELITPVTTLPPKVETKQKQVIILDGGTF